MLALLDAKGPLLSRDVPDTSVVAWPSSGWTNNRNVTQMLEVGCGRGEVAVAARKGRAREGPGHTRVPGGCATTVRGAGAADEERAAAEGAGDREGEHGDHADRAGGRRAGGGEATVEGTQGTWRVDPEQLGQPFTARTALLSPFHRLVHDRVRAAELFEYEHALETYKPKAKRRWGYFALPILHGDRLVGKLDAAADRNAEVLRVDAVH